MSYRLGTARPKGTGRLPTKPNPVETLPLPSLPAQSHALQSCWPTQLTEPLRDGRPCPVSPAPAGRRQGWADTARVKMAQVQAVRVDVSCEILPRQPVFSPIGRTLNMDGMPGLVAVALAKPKLEVSGGGFECPAAAVVAQQPIESVGLPDRLSTRSGDLVQEVEQRDDVCFPFASVAGLLARKEANLS